MAELKIVRGLQYSIFGFYPRARCRKLEESFSIKLTFSTASGSAEP
jgi:hypothetical protein